MICGDRQGTTTGYQYHRTAGQEPCSACAQARRDYMSQWRTRGIRQLAQDGVLVCTDRQGTKWGYRRHRTAGQEPCSACTQAMAPPEPKPRPVRVKKEPIKAVRIEACGDLVGSIEGYAAHRAARQIGCLACRAARDEHKEATRQQAASTRTYRRLPPLAEGELACRDRKGSIAGVARHRVAGQEACKECKKAQRLYSKQVYQNRAEDRMRKEALKRKRENAADFIGVYVVAFDDGTVKVGHSKRVRGRVYEHAKDAKKWGYTMVSHQALSCPDIASARALEQELVGWCLMNAVQVIRREYFAGLSFAQTVTALDDLDAELAA